MAGKEPEQRKLPREILGIEWPTENLDFNTISSIIEASKNKPLRILIANQIIKEGAQLVVELVRSVIPSPKRDDQNIAIKEGFMGTGKLILKAETYLLDQEGFVQYQLRAVDLFRKLAKIESNADEIEEERRMRSDMRQTLIVQKKEAVQSLNIDPRGFHLLKKGFDKRVLIWEKAFKLDNDPEVVGFDKGIERYKQLYLQAVAAGATPDKNSLIQKVKARLTIIPH